MQVGAHRLGTPQADDILVYEEKDTDGSPISRKRSGHFA